MEKKFKFALLILMFNMFISMSGIGLIIPIMPQYLKTFGGEGAVLGFLIASIALAQFIFSPLAGTMSDRLGRKNLIIFGLVMNGVFMILFGMATHLFELYIFRFLTGVGSAFIITPVMAYVADITTGKQRGKAMGQIGASISLGFMIGPGIGGLLSNVNLHFPFYAAGGAAIFAAILTLFFLPATKPVLKDKAKGIGSGNVIKDMRTSFKTPYFVLLLVVFIFTFGIANFQASLSMFLTYKFQFTPNNIAIILTVGGFVGVIIQSLFLDKIFKRFGEMRVILFSLIIAGIFSICMIYISGFFLILVVATIFQTATTVIRPAVNTLISYTAGKEQGFASGMNNAYMSLGNMIGPAIAGTLFDWNMSAPFYVGATVLIFSFFLTYLWQKRTTTSFKSIDD
ncbi:tetracycline resistance MFS efflux pump [Kurthia zopfii]|uniref:DHA1 family multidrug resistance protein-like MFS transporter n=1 Tax=Kurthia zopfii TaxID=1650 RepID=A0A2U3AC13_9BACL|nr:MFS transporter [Kurthia zopfii]PWI21991.1 MFS transporter [Kurthia zopfii]TDR33205.1 DHA1 family multidrug resistance protein-like MFS transporter [Kurthia zopfii]STX08931.1 Metal-tetracycline/H(+) antiporter [Kurthia zopfii]VEI04857.1 Metal-tetracycline/H(+) antiporter [Kurthia zopfii]GEK32185.1 tetracycline resistance MFS efflux pump [Kurthia zopfii]